MTAHEPLHIVQVARRIHPFGGVAGVAHALKVQFDLMGIANSTITLPGNEVRPTSRLAGKLRDLFDVVRFSFTGSIQLRRARGNNVVIINHGDAIGGDIYVDHGLHKAVVIERPSLLLRNPIHLFLLAREELRHRLRSYRYLVTLSNFSRDRLLKYFTFVPSEHIVNIANGVDLQRFSVGRNPEDKSDFRLVFVGHEYERKGLRYVIEALALLPTCVTLSVVGGSSEEIASHKVLAEERGVSERSTFLGRRQDIESQMSRADALILPSRFESWQLVVLEAMASGLIVFGTPVGCVPEVVHEGVNGYTVDQSAASIAEKVNLVLEDRARLPEMRKAARATAEAYGWPTIAAQYIGLAERILAERRRNDR